MRRVRFVGWGEEKRSRGGELGTAHTVAVSNSEWGGGWGGGGV
jgi:hypothetical protein